MEKTLITDIELFAASLAQVRVSVIQRTADDIPVFVDCGLIEKYSTYSVKINGVFYVRDESEYRVDLNT
ncbi:hypothetical protein [Paenibacillus sp. UNC451MF]|uniref:hypothetical protein n=1 Tax=Paenibacillus sp. UNC451MF TaxID=1449063 RepID=UPI000563FC80|nr:hypothetical protein [Paenibacillus sp. UNC451MF]